MFSIPPEGVWLKLGGRGGGGGGEGSASASNVWVAVSPVGWGVLGSLKTAVPRCAPVGVMSGESVEACGVGILDVGM